jgi:GNAT superfamily N-acetyltransferase
MGTCCLNLSKKGCQMEDWTIWPAYSEDLESVMYLLTCQFQEHRISLPGSQLRPAVMSMLSSPELGFILLAGTKAVPSGLACVSFCWTLEHGGKSAWLDELYVKEELRGQGVGSALLGTALEKAGEQGCAAVDLEVDIEHRRAENLYRRAGFTPLSRSRWVRVIESVPGVNK